MSTYICSDIHGLKDRYDRMMECITPSDTLYVLGDVVDRGKDGIPILLDIMQRENVIMLLGNHEYMMKQYYEVTQDESMGMYEVREAVNRWERNHCQPTRDAFEKLSLQQQKEVLDFIDEMPVVITDLRIHDEMFYLVHGCPVISLQEGSWTRKQLLEQGYVIEDFVWNRVLDKETFFVDRTVIIGHTPTLYFTSKVPYEIWTADQSVKDADVIDIDCGCAANDKGTQLALLCLDQREVQYF